MKTLILIGLTLIVSLLPLQAKAESADTVILPHRVMDNVAGEYIDFEELLIRCADADIVTLGENHDDPATHKIELAILEGLYRRNGNVVLSMEMFERDVQANLDKYLAGEITEEEFLDNSRPWGDYEKFYKPMIEFAKEHEFPVIAANIPRSLAKKVGQSGYDKVEWTEEELPWVARTFEAPKDEYWEEFRETMLMMSEDHGESGGMSGMPEEMIELIYQAQVIKDETMAESVTDAHERYPDSVIYHVTGAFHNGNNLGTHSRIIRNAPDAKVISIVVVPLADLTDQPDEETFGADYWIYVLAPPAEEKPESEEN